MGDVKPEATSSGAKIVLPNGQRIALGVQSGSLFALLWLGWNAKDVYEGVMEEAERTREAVSAMSTRLDKVDTALVQLSDNAERTTALDAEVVKLREAQARLQLEVAAALACAKDKRRCSP